ncbi:MAG: hypothetical protein QOI31_2179 [Solirubrobacterales bacterium]|nr:hypothetical protein [Solirubrobacterales bacterium]
MIAHQAVGEALPLTMGAFLSYKQQIRVTIDVIDEYWATVIAACKHVIDAIGQYSSRQSRHTYE